MSRWGEGGEHCQGGGRGVNIVKVGGGGFVKVGGVSTDKIVKEGGGGGGGVHIVKVVGTKSSQMA